MTAQPKKHNIALINCKYSANLGDGVIAESMEYSLRQHMVDGKVFSVDIAGNDEYGHSNSAAPKTLAPLIDNLPKPLRHLVKSTLRPYVVKLKSQRKWREQLSDTDMLIVGGGQLIMDVDCYFPTRIAMIVQSAPKNVALCFHAVGVSAELSAKAKHYFRQAVAHAKLISVSVRDDNAKKNWERHFPDIPATVVPDPAVFCNEAFAPLPLKDMADGKKPLVALGVSLPSDMMKHSDNPDKAIGHHPDFYLTIIRELVAKGYAIRLFHNGADGEYYEVVKEAIIRSIADYQRVVEFQPTPRTPKELVQQIAPADILISHRLHANIIAYSLNIPSVGLAWDSKLKSFFTLTERSAFLIEENNPLLVVQKAIDAGQQGIDGKVYHAVQLKAKAGLEETLNIAV